MLEKKTHQELLTVMIIVLTSESGVCYSADFWSVYRRKYLSLLAMFLYFFPEHSLLPRIVSGINSPLNEGDLLSLLLLQF